MATRKSRALLKDLAKQRFHDLVKFSEELAKKGDWRLSSMVGEQAFKIAKKGGYRVPIEMKRKFCRRCHIPLFPGITARVRLRKKGDTVLVVTCLNCGYTRRYPVKRGEGAKEKTLTN